MSSASRLIDLSHPLNAETQIYPGDPPFAPDSARDARARRVLRASPRARHAHRDAHRRPAPLRPGGRTAAALPLAACVGVPLVVDLSAVACRRVSRSRGRGLRRSSMVRCPARTAAARASCWSTRAGRRRTTGRRRTSRTPYLLPEVADALLARGVSLVGTDTLSPDETPAEGAEGAACVQVPRNIPRVWRGYRGEPDELGSSRRGAACGRAVDCEPRPTAARRRRRVACSRVCTQPF